MLYPFYERPDLKPIYPHYNQEAYQKRLVNSVLPQTKVDACRQNHSNYILIQFSSEWDVDKREKIKKSEQYLTKFFFFLVKSNVTKEDVKSNIFFYSSCTLFNLGERFKPLFMRKFNWVLIATKNH